ncbi:hypothetical protein GCM10022227_54150 [Streptomyces sedi]
MSKARSRWFGPCRFFMPSVVSRGGRETPGRMEAWGAGVLHPDHTIGLLLGHPLTLKWRVPGGWLTVWA